MVLSIEKYRHIKELREYIKLRDDMVEKDSLDYDKVSQTCSTSSLNIIAVYSFLGEDVLQWKELCDNKVKSLKVFYGYE